MLDSVRGSHVVLLMGLACVVQTVDLVCPYNHPGCHCREQAVECRSLQEMPVLWRGGSVVPVKHLILRNGNITSVTKTSLPSNLESISLYDVSVAHMCDNAFDLSARSLRKFQINLANVHTLPRALSRVTSLVDLRIEDTPIQHWDGAVLQHISRSLVYLKLKNVTLFAWPGWLFHFHYLQSLDLSFNSLTFIPCNAFATLTNSLTRLYLVGTGFTHVPPAISCLRRLRHVTLSNNNFTAVTEMNAITESEFSQTLLTIRLTSAGMTRMPIFSNFASLELVDFSYNRISVVPAGTLPPTLTSLELAYNILTSVPHDVTTLPGLVNLNLEGNQITQISPSSFPSSLIYLDLSHNNFTAINGDTFRNLTSLQKLHLDYTPITSIAPSAFSDLESLSLLTLLHTHLTQIPMEFTSLGSQIEITMTTVQPLFCPCPTNRHLSQWYLLLTNPGLEFVYCTNGLRADLYLIGQCFTQ